jgi:Ser/Thr protein kinase RdoA (MazF antagonist)
LATPDHNPIVLDFEVAHTGNPVFDLAFISAHLLCKTIRTQSAAEKAEITSAALNFLDSYRQTSQISIAKSLPLHVALIALARVEGVSPVNYLDEPAQQELVAITKAALLDSTMTYEQLFESAK